MRRRIGVRDLRNQLSGVINAAIAGEQITITMRGTPVATLGPAETTSTEITLDGLSSVGFIEPPRRRDQPNAPHPHVLPADVRLDRVLDQVRGRE